MLGENIVACMLLLFPAFTCAKISRKACSAANDEVIYILYQANFNFLVSKQIINTSGDCQIITQDEIDL